MKLNNQYLRRNIGNLRKSAKKHRNDIRPGRRRFGLHDYLADVFAIYLELESKGGARKAARRIVKLFRLSLRKGSHPIRVLIEASAPLEDPRQKSRWTQALRYALTWSGGPDKVKLCLKGLGGVAGCAKKLAAYTGTSRQKKSTEMAGSGDHASAQGDPVPRHV